MCTPTFFLYSNNGCVIPSPTELQHNLARLIPTANLLEIPDPSLPCESPSLHPAHSLTNTPNTPSLLQPGPTLNLPSFSPEWERRAARSKGGDERFSFPFGFFAFWIFHATPATQRKTGNQPKYGKLRAQEREFDRIAAVVLFLAQSSGTASKKKN